uniref:Peptidase C45 hydrolase domain-containing protein n=1 Tax=Strigamia maritima TaxID=126957 RepID=T1J874_STRMM
MDNCMPILFCRGTYYEVSHLIGKTYKTRIQEYYKSFEDLHERFVPFYYTAKGKKICDDYLHVVKSSFPQYVKEMQGLSDGAEISFELVFLMHLRVELQTYLGKQQVPECSTIYINNEKSSALLHNEDTSASVINRGYMICAHITEAESLGKHETKEENFIAYCYPGLIPGNSVNVNHHGFIFTLNALYPELLQLARTPRQIINRAVLSASSLDQVRSIFIDEGNGIATGCSTNVGKFDQAERLLWNFELAPSENEKKSVLVELTVRMDGVNGKSDFCCCEVCAASRLFWACSRFARSSRRGPSSASIKANKWRSSSGENACTSSNGQYLVEACRLVFMPHITSSRCFTHRSLFGNLRRPWLIVWIVRSASPLAWWKYGARQIINRAVLSASSLDQVRSIFIDEGNGIATGCSTNVGKFDQAERLLWNFELAPSENEKKSVLVELTVRMDGVNGKSDVIGHYNHFNIINLGFMGEKENLSLYNIEVGPSKDKFESVYSIHTVNKIETYLHCNVYKHLKIPVKKESCLKSSNHREIVYKNCLCPTDTKSVLAFLGDYSDEMYPIFRDGQAPDIALTILTAFLEKIGGILADFHLLESADFSGI